MIKLSDIVVNIREPVQRWLVVLIWTSPRYGKRRLAWLVPADSKSSPRFFTPAFIDDLVVA
jgi:hypothetical protein